MLEISLPDGSKKIYQHSISVLDVAKDIGTGLASATLAGRVNGVLVDVDTVISENSQVEMITKNDADGIEIIRHSTAHLLAMATQSLFPGTQVTIGPVIQDGFYYDFAYERQFTQADLELIENKMKELVKQDLPITKRVVNRDEAIQLFSALGENYKVEIIQSIEENEPLNLYHQGQWFDLCRGPHVPSTGYLKVFKLMRVAGAYWRGDANNEMLSRIYGTAWGDKKSLKEYLVRLEEAEKRDHRKLAKKLNLFHMQEEAPGMVFWHPKGWALYQVLENYMREEQKKHGYLEIKTPQLVDKSLWELSGHCEKFDDDMFTTYSENKAVIVKPMNCPCHVQVFNQGIKSYKDLPIRFAEFGSCHRNEPSGALHGLMRVRAFTQDDAHIFITQEQIQSEVAHFIDFLHQVYEDFGFERNALEYKLSTRPTKRVGSDEIWDEAENALAQALNAKEINWTISPGEGAFYGPKVEFILKDAIGRQWQCGTVQVDFNTPNRLSASYIDSQGKKNTPIMLHRAILGSFERFIGILIEHFAGNLPFWLAPTQAVLMNITDQQQDYAKKIVCELQKNGFRIESDLRNEKIGFKIREHTLNKVPFMLIVGAQEIENKTITLRSQSGEDFGSHSIESLIEFFMKQNNRKCRA